MMQERDVGARALQYVFERMRIDDVWSVREPRSFTWWGKDYAQRVSATEPTQDRGVLVSRLMAVTDVVIGVPEGAKTFAALDVLNGSGGTLSGLVYDWSAGIVRYVTSATIHEQNENWIRELFAHCVAMQAAEAQLNGEWLADQFGGLPATCVHPVSGPRPDYDDMLNYLAAIIVPAGQQPSRWVGEEMERTLDILRKFSLAAVGDHRGVSAEFPYRDHASLLEVYAARRDDRIGTGLSMTLHLPEVGNRETLAPVAAAMNVLELDMNPFGHFRGSWCVSERSAIAFRAFYPNFLGGNGLAANLVLQMAGRAEWVATITDERSREERWKTACPSFLRALAARD